MLFFQNICTLNTRLDGNIKSKSSNNNYLNIVKIFNKLFKIMNMIKMQNLGVISTWKNRHFKFTELFNVSCHKGVMYTIRRIYLGNKIGWETRSTRPRLDPYPHHNGKQT